MFSPRRFLSLLLPTVLALSSGWAGDGEMVSRPGQLRLNLAEAVRLALAKNFTIQVQKFAPQVAREVETQEWGIFDPFLELGGSRAYDSSRSRLGLDGLRTDGTLINRTDRLAEATISGLTPLGTEYRFGFSAINNRRAGQLGDRYEAGPTASVTQPLLRGLGLNANMAGIRIARTNVEINEWQLRGRVIDVITELVYTYNDLNFATENEKVAIRSRELARQLLQDNTRRAEIGVMSPLDITTARAQVASREEGVILALRARRDNEITLKRLVTDEMEQMLAIDVEIAPPPFSQIQTDVHANIRVALELRPDYQSQLLTLRNRHITVAFQKNQVLPRLDLVGSLGFLGFDTQFANSFGRIGEGDSLSWSAGAVFSIPLGNHAARGSFNAARLQAAQALVELKRIEQQIVVDVEIAAGQVTTGRARIASTTEASRLAKESLDAGEQRLKAGTGTTFEVLELQRQLAQAEVAELRARADYNRAVAEFYRKTGRTLREQHVDLQ